MNFFLCCNITYCIFCPYIFDVFSICNVESGEEKIKTLHQIVCTKLLTASVIFIFTFLETVGLPCTINMAVSYVTLAWCATIFHVKSLENWKCMQATFFHQPLRFAPARTRSLRPGHPFSLVSSADLGHPGVISSGP